MALQAGDVYWLTVTYPDNNIEETRPVLIYDIQDDLPIIASFATVTGSKIKQFDHRYDKWKSPIFDWKSAGLDKGSYVKANNIAEVKADVFKADNFIGNLTSYDLKNALKKIDEFIDSGEDPW